LPVRYQDVDADLRCTPICLVSGMQEAAILQSEDLGRGMAWLAERQQVWMIVQTLLHIARLPRWRAALRITTWPSDIGRLLSRREFIVGDADGECARATTRWAYVDTARHRVTRVPPELSGSYPIDAQRAIPGPLPRPARIDSALVEDARPVRLADIDSNGHVNNLRYLAWMLDSLPADLAAGVRPTRLNVRYQRETGPGERIVARVGELPTEASGHRRFGHEVLLAGSGERIAIAESVWAQA
jgi:acyl-ACP thioesterase